MLRIDILLVAILAAAGLALTNHAWAQALAPEQDASANSTLAQTSGCTLLNLTYCQLQLDPNAGFALDHDGRSDANLWPHDSPLFLNYNKPLYTPTLSLSVPLLDAEAFAISSRLNFWDYSNHSDELLNRDALTLDLNANYRFSKGALRFNPGGSLTYSNTDPLLSVSSHEALTLSLNGEVSYALSQNWGLLLPFASFQWTYQFDILDTPSGYRWINDLSGQSLSVSPEQTLKLEDQDYFNLGVGFSAQFRNGAAGFINYQKLLSHDELDDYRLRAGLRFEF